MLVGAATGAAPRIRLDTLGLHSVGSGGSSPAGDRRGARLAAAREGRLQLARRRPLRRPRCTIPRSPSPRAAATCRHELPPDRGARRRCAARSTRDGHHGVRSRARHARLRADAGPHRPRRAVLGARAAAAGGGSMRRALFMAKGSLFLGRMTEHGRRHVRPPGPRRLSAAPVRPAKDGPRRACRAPRAGPRCALPRCGRRRRVALRGSLDRGGDAGGACVAAPRAGPARPRCTWNASAPACASRPRRARRTCRRRARAIRTPPTRAVRCSRSARSPSRRRSRTRRMGGTARGGGWRLAGSVGDPQPRGFTAEEFRAAAPVPVRIRPAARWTATFASRSRARGDDADVCVVGLGAAGGVIAAAMRGGGAARHRHRGRCRDRAREAPTSVSSRRDARSSGASPSISSSTVGPPIRGSWLARNIGVRRSAPLDDDHVPLPPIRLPRTHRVRTGRGPRAWPTGRSRTRELEPYYDRAEREIGVAGSAGCESV